MSYNFLTNPVGYCLIALAACLAGCNPSSTTEKENSANNPTPNNSNLDPQTDETKSQPTTSQEIESAELSVLFIGNSHSAPIPHLLQQLFETNRPDSNVLIRREKSFGFLVDHANRPSTRNLIEAGPWDFVVLQAQKYSTSGKFVYPTDGAIELAELAKKSGAKIVMYPEWSRRDSPNEYSRIKAIHQAIAEQVDASVAPIGEAWNTVADQHPGFEMYAVDGNHASHLGSYLNACVFYCMLTGQPIENKSQTNAQSEREFQQTILEEIAWQMTQSLR